MFYSFYTVNPDKRDYIHYMKKDSYERLTRYDEYPYSSRINLHFGYFIAGFMIGYDVLDTINRNDLIGGLNILDRFFDPKSKDGGKFMEFFNKCLISDPEKENEENRYAIFSVENYLFVVKREDYFGPLYIIQYVGKQPALQIDDNLEHRIRVKTLEKYSIKTTLSG